MALNMTALCSERHYMGSASNGRFTTDRDVRPDYDRRPSASQLRHRAACRPAWHARYLREQNVVALAVDCRAAKDELAAGEARMAELAAAIGVARASDDEVRLARLESAREWLATQLDATLEHRRWLSHQLRVLGISPKEETLIAEEALRRMATARAS